MPRPTNHVTRSSRRALAAACFLLLLAGVVGCGEGDERTVAPAPAETVARAHCPGSAGAGCRSATGEIIYVERVDPDGDGDAHLVILDPQGITFRGLTSIDVRAGLRPHPLPGPGDLVSAAGPVQTGSFGQDQIHALVLNVGTPE
jgi:hypothetical protein